MTTADHGRRSKKPSAASFASLDELTFFVDRSLGKVKVATALRHKGLHVLVHDDEFPIDCPDVEWLRRAGQEKWVVLTGDTRIRRKPHEQAALMSSGVRTFVLSSGNLTGDEMAGAFVKALPPMTRLLRNHGGPFVASVTRSGSVALLLPREDSG